MYKSDRVSDQLFGLPLCLLPLGHLCSSHLCREGLPRELLVVETTLSCFGLLYHGDVLHKDVSGTITAIKTKNSQFVDWYLSHGPQGWYQLLVSSVVSRSLAKVQHGMCHEYSEQHACCY